MGEEPQLRTLRPIPVSRFRCRLAAYCALCVYPYIVRNKNSAGHAVKNKIPNEPTSNPRQFPQCGSNAMNRIFIPSGIATHPNKTKLPSTYNSQRLPQPIEYPTPFALRTSRKHASATFTAISTVNTYASRPPGYGHIQCVGPNFTNTHKPATIKKSSQLPAAAPPDETANPSGTNTNAAIVPARSTANVPVPTR